MKKYSLLVLLCLFIGCTSTEESETGELIAIDDMKFNFSVTVNSNNQVTCKAVFSKSSDRAFFTRLILSRGERIYCNGVELKRPRSIFSSHYEAHLSHTDSFYTFNFVRENSGNAYVATVQVPELLEVSSPLPHATYKFGENIQITWNESRCCSIEASLGAREFSAPELEESFKVEASREGGLLNLRPRISLSAPSTIDTVLTIKRSLQGNMNFLNGDIRVSVEERVPVLLVRD